MPKTALTTEQLKTRHLWAKRLSLVPGAILLSPLLLLAGLAWLCYVMAANTKYRLLAAMALCVPLIALYFTPFLLLILIPLGIFYLALLGLSDYISNTFYNDPDTLFGQMYRYFYAALLFAAITASLAVGSWLLFGATISAAYSAIAAFAVTLPFMAMFPPVGAVILLGLAAVASIALLSYQLYQIAGQLYPDPNKVTTPASTANPISVKPEPPSLPPSPPVMSSTSPALPLSPTAKANSAPLLPITSSAASHLPTLPAAPGSSSTTPAHALPTASLLTRSRSHSSDSADDRRPLLPKGSQEIEMVNLANADNDRVPLVPPPAPAAKK